ncbi:MAG: 2,3-bisphosphoglycerate-independent phosphoglycerate mutase [Chloroflexota bacterium]
MADLRLMRELRQKTPSKIVLLVMDGLGGLPIEPGGPTELEAASKPNLDRLAAEGTIGQLIPVRPGITPGSGPAHLALFGYDPLEHEVGRGVLEAIGVGLEVHKGDVAARGNFCTVNAFGKITDRRAGRIPTEQAVPLVERLAKLQLTGVRTEVRHVKEYRFAVVMRGDGLVPEIADTDPQQTGLEPLPARPLTPAAQRTADLFNAWMSRARQVLADQPKANSLTLRGFSTDPGLPRFPEIYGLRAACVAVYPMYKGVARLVGMEILRVEGERPEDEFAVVARAWDEYDFFFIHIKKTDSTGEDGDFAAKSAVIESVDTALPTLLDLKPEVLAVTGDHSTPARMRTHTWHPVPLLLWAPKTGLPDDQVAFGERACSIGGLGTLPASDLMPLLMAHAGRLAKFGA